MNPELEAKLAEMGDISLAYTQSDMVLTVGIPPAMAAQFVGG